VSSTVISADGAGMATPVRATQEKYWPPAAAATADRAAPSDAGPSRCSRSSPLQAGATATTTPPARDKARTGMPGWSALATATPPAARRATGSP
jgi:hypothetical protein